MRSPAHRSWGLYCLWFALLFLAGTGAHYIARPYIAPIVNRTLNARVSAWLINLMSPRAHVIVAGSRFGSGNAYLQIAQGCEGVDVVLMMVAAILPFPASRQRRCVGVLAGTVVLYAFNLLRSVSLWYCLRDWPSYFEVAHTLVGQTMLIFVGLVFFGIWSGQFDRPRSAAVPT